MSATRLTLRRSLERLPDWFTSGALLTFCTLSWISALISFAAVALRWRRLRTSDATTAKPAALLAGARASTAALSASRLVWNAICRSRR